MFSWSLVPYFHYHSWAACRNLCVSSEVPCGSYTECPTRYRTLHFFNNSNTNEDIATKFEQEYVLFFHIFYTMRKARFKFRCNILISGKIIKEMPGSVASGTPCIIQVYASIEIGELRLTAHLTTSPVVDMV